VKHKHTSLPHIITTGLVLISLALAQSWEQSTPRERQALAVVAMGEVQALVSVAAWIAPGIRGGGI
jgi:type II secretory pathway component PulM